MENFMLNSRNRPALPIRTGLTLIEILIALTMTLIVLGAMMTAFAYASQQMQMGRGVMEMANRLRAAEELLRSDLSHVTVDPRPYTESTNPNGYWEYVEGPSLDNVTAPGSNYLGDLDDIWAATIRSETRPFRGRYIFPPDALASGWTISNPASEPVTVIESPLAEVVWWTDYVENDGNYQVGFDESVTIYRRALLIVPNTVRLPRFVNFGAAASYLATNDISARIVEIVDSGTTYYQLVANTLKDLAHRQVRFGHNPVLGAGVGIAPAPAGYPHWLHRNTLWLMRSADYNLSGSLDLAGGGLFAMEPNGSDIMLTDVAGFDVKVFSPDAAVLDWSSHPTDPINVIVEPSDPGYANALSTLTPAQLAAMTRSIGAYVDLGVLGAIGGDAFTVNPTAKSGLSYQFMFDYRFPRNLPGPPVIPPAWGGLLDRAYDTWTPFYESDGVDQDGVAGADQGTNGINDGGTLAPDDEAERETRPPYPYPVRGVKVSIRLVEKTTKQIHQSSVIHSYVPE